MAFADLTTEEQTQLAAFVQALRLVHRKAEVVRVDSEKIEHLYNGSINTILAKLAASDLIDDSPTGVQIQVSKAQIGTLLVLLAPLVADDGFDSPANSQLRLSFAGI